MASTRTDYPVMLPNGEVKQGRADDSGTIMCATCGGPAPIHLFRPACGYRCVTCCETYGTAPTVTDAVTLTVTLSADGTMVPHPATPA
jgi:hypothetical protein